MSIKELLEKNLNVELEESSEPFEDEDKIEYGRWIDSGDEPFENWYLFKCDKGVIFRALNHIGGEHILRFRFKSKDIKC